VEDEVAGLLEIVEDVGDGADVAPVGLVGIELEMIGAQLLQAGQDNVDLGLLGDEGLDGLLVLGGLLLHVRRSFGLSMCPMNASSGGKSHWTIG
jgi:hypothetical protein